MGWKPVLDLWFGQGYDPAAVLARQRALWFSSTPALDDQVRTTLGDLHAEAAIGALDHWANLPVGRLALIILLDQVSRQLYRGHARAYEQDSKALQLARDGIDQGMDQQLAPLQRLFFYLPFEHSEQMGTQHQSLALFRFLRQQGELYSPAIADAFAEFERYAHQHFEDIRTFGRFPYRNAALGRASTPAEEQYLRRA